MRALRGGGVWGAGQEGRGGRGEAGFRCNPVSLRTPARVMPARVPSLSPPLPRAPSPQASGAGSGAPTLVQRASTQLFRDLSPSCVVSVLRGVDLLSPVVPGLRVATLTYAAEHLRGVLDADAAGLAGLPGPLLAEILACHSLGADEGDAFRVVAAWAAARDAEPGAGASEADLDLLLPHIRFPLMTTEQLEVRVSALKVFTRTALLLLVLVVVVVLLLLLVLVLLLPLPPACRAVAPTFTDGCGQAGAPTLQQPPPPVPPPTPTPPRAQELQAHPLWRRSGLLRELVEEAQQLEQALSGSPGRVGSGSRSGRALPGPPPDARAPRLPSRHEAVLTARFLPRRSPGCTELLLVCPGDKNGVTHWLGTRGGQQPWVNPALTGRVRVLASSPSCRSTRPASCVAPGPPRLNFAAPRSESGRLAAWWVLDLGPWHRLAPTAYTLRHDGSRDPLRCWELQGSRDGRDGWQTLRVHDGDASLRLAGGWAAWQVVGHGASVPFRAFRVLVTAPQPGNDNPWHASLAQMEFYGLLHAAGGE